MPTVYSIAMSTASMIPFAGPYQIICKCSLKAGLYLQQTLQGVKLIKFEQFLL